MIDRLKDLLERAGLTLFLEEPDCYHYSYYDEPVGHIEVVNEGHYDEHQVNLSIKGWDKVLNYIDDLDEKAGG